MKSKTVVESIDWFGREEPDRVAYQSDDARYTFGELKKKIRCISKLFSEECSWQ